MAIILALFTSCQENEVESPETHSTYLPLAIGNYWVYEHYRVDSLGVETLLPDIDSVYVSRDTLIRNNQYFILEGRTIPYTRVQILRDSLQYLVNEKGDILFSEKNFDDILSTSLEITNDNDTILKSYSKMHLTNDPVVLSAGTFNDVLNFQADIYLDFYSVQTGQTKLNNYYAPNVGRIQYSYLWAHSFLNDGVRFELRLLRYNIENSEDYPDN